MGIIDASLAKFIANSDHPERILPGLARITPDMLAWLNDSEDNTIADYPGPGWDEPRPTAGPDFTPSEWDDAYWLGYTIRLEGHGHAVAPAHYEPLRRVDFYIGQIDAGLEIVRRERAELLERDRLADERYADAFGDPADRIHDAEARGVC